jgi:hypothetical protein
MLISERSQSALCSDRYRASVCASVCLREAEMSNLTNHLAQDGVKLNKSQSLLSSQSAVELVGGVGEVRTEKGGKQGVDIRDTSRGGRDDDDIHIRVWE